MALMMAQSNKLGLDPGFGLSECTGMASQTPVPVLSPQTEMLRCVGAPR